MLINSINTIIHVCILLFPELSVTKKFPYSLESKYYDLKQVVLDTNFPEENFVPEINNANAKLQFQSLFHKPFDNATFS